MHYSELSALSERFISASQYQDLQEQKCVKNVYENANLLASFMEKLLTRCIVGKKQKKIMWAAAEIKSSD